MRAVDRENAALSFPLPPEAQPEGRGSQHSPAPCYRSGQSWPTSQLPQTEEEETPARVRKDDQRVNVGHKPYHLTLLLIFSITSTHIPHAQITDQVCYQKEAIRISSPGLESSSTPITTFTDEETKVPGGPESQPSRLPASRRESGRCVPAVRVTASDKGFSSQSAAPALGLQQK